MKLTLKYLLYFILLFAVETLIAIYVHDSFIRPFIGDVLVVVLLYFFLRIFINKHQNIIALGVFVFACFIEFLQYIKIVETLGLQNNRIASVVIGTTFDWMDILAYFTGCLAIYIYNTNLTIK